MFGGASNSGPEMIPADIEIRRNHFYKPMDWYNKDGPNWSQDWTVKNHLESKMSQRVLVEGNVFENMWEHAQNFSINLKSENQGGKNNPWAVTEHWTFRYNKFVNVGDAITLTKSYPNSAPANTFLFIDNLILMNTNIGKGQPFRGFDINDLTFINNTIIGSGLNLTVFGTNVSEGLVYTNNIGSHGDWGIKADGTRAGTATLEQAYPSGYVFQKNLIIGGNSIIYPEDNFFPANVADVGFVDFGGGNYRLSGSSPYKNAGTDGRDLGADIDAVERAIRGTCSDDM